MLCRAPFLVQPRLRSTEDGGRLVFCPANSALSCRAETARLCGGCALAIRGCTARLQFQIRSVSIAFSCVLAGWPALHKRRRHDTASTQNSAQVECHPFQSQCGNSGPSHRQPHTYPRSQLGQGWRPLRSAPVGGSQAGGRPSVFDEGQPSRGCLAAKCVRARQATVRQGPVSVAVNGASN